MKHEFVTTSNYRNFHEAIGRVERRGAPEARFVVVSGEPGRSKSTITQNWAIQTSAVHLRAMQGWTPKIFLKEVAANLKIDPSGAAHDLFKRVFERLAALGFPNIVVDEFQYCLADNAATLEKIRDISDMIPEAVNSVIVLVAGDGKALTNVTRFPAINSRIAEKVEFDLATIHDITLLCKRLAEVEIKPDLIAQILTESKGVMRLAVNAIAACEELAKLNNITSIGAAQVKLSGAALCADWRSGSSGNTNLKRVS